METSGPTSFLQNLSLEGPFNGRFLHPSSAPTKTKVPPPPQLHEGGMREGDGGEEVADEDDRWTTVAVSALRVVACFLTMMLTTAVWAVVMLVMLPWPYARVRQGNFYGHVTGKLMMWILGNPIKIEGSEFSNTRAIYICNHASPLDIFLMMWLTPTGTVGIAKKEMDKTLNYACSDNLVSTLWSTLCACKPSSNRSVKSNCCQRINQRGCPNNCQEELISDHIPRGHKV